MEVVAGKSRQIMCTESHPKIDSIRGRLSGTKGTCTRNKALTDTFIILVDV